MRLLTKISRYIFVITCCAPSAFAQSPGNEIRFNEQFIETLQNNIDLNNPLKVFEYVFSNLSSEITIYPTENYYYFECCSSGIKLKGNLALFADTRDQGLLNFSYEAVSIYNDKDSSGIDIVITFSNDDGIKLSKLTDFKYSLTYHERSVLVNLNSEGFYPPPEEHLLPGEIYVGPSFDESGLKFYLIFNAEFNHLFWVLNEDQNVPETFFSYTADIQIGKRTEFAFYNDTLLHRKVLFGVNKDNVELNNWYDGPFDQLPDNFVKTGQINLRQYLEKHDPFCKGKIDEYGHFTEQKEYRVALSSYLIYGNREELIKVMMACKNSSKTSTELLFHLTTERELNKSSL